MGKNFFVYVDPFVTDVVFTVVDLEKNLNCVLPATLVFTVVDLEKT
jgi:hypothetical protein